MSFVPTIDVKIKDQGRRDVRSKELNELIGVELGKRRVAMFVVVVLVFELGRQSFSFGTGTWRKLLTQSTLSLSLSLSFSFSISFSIYYRVSLIIILCEYRKRLHRCRQVCQVAVQKLLSMSSIGNSELWTWVDSID